MEFIKDNLIEFIQLVMYIGTIILILVLLLNSNKD